MRFGIHSGPVTAGVLRGDKQRFQLFGDTVNTGTMSFICSKAKFTSISCSMILIFVSISFDRRSV